MRYLIGFMCVCALGMVPLVGCTDAEGGGGMGGDGGSGGSAGDGGSGGTVACVDNVCPCSEAGILAAIEAGGNDPYTFDCDGSQTVLTNAEIVIDNDVILDGQGTLTVDATLGRVFSVPEGVTAELRGLTVTGGAVVADHGAGIASHGTLTIRNCVISGNYAGEEFYDDFGSGGGIRNTGELTIIDSTISHNGSSWGDGGGISNAGSGTLTLTDSIVSGNRADDGRGGGIDNASTASLTITNSTISENWANLCSLCDFVGDGISNAGEMTVINSTVWDNEGIGIENTDGVAMLTGSTVSKNYANGIHNAGEMAVIDSTVSENGSFDHVVVAGRGAGIVNREALTLINSTVSGNSADGNGGGIWNEGTLTISSSTVSGNTTGEQGSAVYAHEGSAIETALTLIDGDCASFVDEVTWVSNGYNIESTGDTCGFDPDGTDQVNVSADDLKLGELADNGGPTMTHALLPGSVAIDHIPAVDCEVDEDQRGEPRPETGGTMCDVGAFEVQP